MSISDVVFGSYGSVLTDIRSCFALREKVVGGSQEDRWALAGVFFIAAEHWLDGIALIVLPGGAHLRRLCHA